MEADSIFHAYSVQNTENLSSWQGEGIYIYIEIKIDIYVWILSISSRSSKTSLIWAQRPRVHEKERIAFRILTRSGVGPLAGWRHE